MIAVHAFPTENVAFFVGLHLQHTNIARWAEYDLGFIVSHKRLEKVVLGSLSSQVSKRDPTKKLVSFEYAKARESRAD
jgi:hypothetical protein